MAKAKKEKKTTLKKVLSGEHSLLNMPEPMQKKIDQILAQVEKSEAGLMDLSKVALRVLKKATEVSTALKEKMAPVGKSELSLKVKRTIKSGAAKAKAPLKKTLKKANTKK